MAAAPLPPLPDSPRVSAIVPARRSEATIRSCLDSVLAQSPAVHEVVVAVASDDAGTREAVVPAAEKDPRVRVVENPSGRTPDGLNAALEVSTGQVIVRVDAHAELPGGYVARAVESLKKTGAANVGGRQVPTATEGFAAAVAAAMASPLGAGGAAYRTGSVAGIVDTVYLGAFRREALDEVGGFDPRFTRNQDAELNERLRRAGYLVWFDPELSVAYHPRASVRSLAAQYWQYGRWRRMTASVHPGSLRPRQLAAPLVVFGLAASLVTGGVLRDWRTPALAFGGYGVLLLVGGHRVASGHPARPLQVTAALATMHLSWGSGFLVGPPRSARRD